MHVCSDVNTKFMAMLKGLLAVLSVYMMCIKPFITCWPDLTFYESTTCDLPATFIFIKIFQFPTLLIEKKIGTVIVKGCLAPDRILIETCSIQVVAFANLRTTLY